MKWDESGMENVRRWEVCLFMGRLFLLMGRMGKRMRNVANPVSWVSQQSAEMAKTKTETILD